MTIRYNIAKTTSKILAFALKRVAHTNASNLPGRVALKVDPDVLKSEVSEKIQGKKIMIVGTNGKTSVTNLIADILVESGRKIVCNRSGANMKTGITSTLLQNGRAEFGVFESDELWLRESICDIKANYVLLLNLFRDQLDRCGEIERIQSSISEALNSCPSATLIYNADDPLCVEVAKSVNNDVVSFGIDEPLQLVQNTIMDTTVCQCCDNMLTYKYHQYDKLGDFYCEKCGFSRPNCDWKTTNVEMGEKGIEFQLNGRDVTYAFASPLLGTYNVYNLSACAVAGILLGADHADIQKAFSAFNPKNGRLQHLNIAGKDMLLNLAKNPTGFNQNLRIIGDLADKNEKISVAFFINDLTADGHDISWIWDIDFEELARKRNLIFYAGGIRKNDLQVRLKYADIEAELVDDVSQVLTNDVSQVFVIANYTALPEVKKSLAQFKVVSEQTSTQPAVKSREVKQQSGEAIRIAHVLPELLNLYGDGGNLRIFSKRCEWRGIPCEIEKFGLDSNFNLDEVDLVFLGGGPDREQRIATEFLMNQRLAFRNYVEEGGPLLAICGGYQILGSTWLLGKDEVPGLGILDIKTRRPGTSADRLTNNIALETTITNSYVVGFENHAGRTYLGEGIQPFGKTVSKTGAGNNEKDKSDGVIYKNTIGTYLHGPLLSKNPEVADYLLNHAIERHKSRTGQSYDLFKIDDNEETRAKEYILSKICN